MDKVNIVIGIILLIVMYASYVIINDYDASDSIKRIVDDIEVNKTVVSVRQNILRKLLRYDIHDNLYVDRNFVKEEENTFFINKMMRFRGNMFLRDLIDSMRIASIYILFKIYKVYVYNFIFHYSLKSDLFNKLKKNYGRFFRDIADYADHFRVKELVYPGEIIRYMYQLNKSVLEGNNANKKENDDFNLIINEIQKTVIDKLTPTYGTFDYKSIVDMGIKYLANEASKFDDYGIDFPIHDDAYFNTSQIVVLYNSIIYEVAVISIVVREYNHILIEAIKQHKRQLEAENLANQMKETAFKAKESLKGIPIISTAINAAEKLFGMLDEDTQEDIKSVANYITDKLASGLTRVGEYIPDVVKDKVKKEFSNAVHVAGVLASSAVKIGSTISSTAHRMVNTVSDTISNAASSVGGFLKDKLTFWKFNFPTDEDIEMIDKSKPLHSVRLNVMNDSMYAKNILRIYSIFMSNIYAHIDNDNDNNMLFLVYVGYSLNINIIIDKEKVDVEEYTSILDRKNVLTNKEVSLSITQWLKTYNVNDIIKYRKDMMMGER